MNLTFTGAIQEIPVQIPIIDDVIYENPEMFTANLMIVTSNVNTEINPSQATITITDDDCELFANLTDSLCINTIHIQSLS